MKNLKKLEKSKGVLLYATNTDTVDYLSIANINRQLIERYLQLPVTIVSSESSSNRRYNIDSNEFEQWNNLGRHTAYDDSPYDITLLLDCDYLVFDSNLLKILDGVSGYKIARHNRFVEGTSPNLIHRYSLPQLWATVVAFDRSETSKMLFDLVGRIQRNYGYYTRLYNIPAGNYRNDYAFTIADNILNGYCQDASNYLPWPIVSISQPIQSLRLQGDKFYLRSGDRGYVLPKQDLHIMSKAWFASEDCRTVIKEALNA